VIVISDTSAILNLNIIGKLNLLKLLYGKVIIPDAVYEELLELEKTKGGYTSIDSLNWIEIRKISNKLFVENLKEKLDSGESEAIVLAKELNAEALVIDESKGRKIAVGLGLNVIGIIGILIQAKDRGVITKVKPVMDALINKAGFWIREELYQNVLQEVQE